MFKNNILLIISFNLDSIITLTINFITNLLFYTTYNFLIVMDES